MKKTVFYAFAAALALVSCAKEQAPVVSNEVVTRIYAAMDPVKSTVGIDGTTAHFSWTSGEVISVATAEGFTDFTCANTSTGEFTHAGEVTPLNVAVSPAQTTDKFTSETNFKVGLPAVYTYVEGKTNAILVGTKGEGDKYIFGHAAALLSITYENLPEGTKGISVTADEEIAGIVTLSGTSASAIEIKNDNAGLSEKTVSISHDATVGNTASRTYYLPLPTGTYETITFHLIHENDAIETSTTKTVKNVTLERGNYAALPAATLAEGFAPYTVGAEDNTSGFFAEKSASYAIPAGKVLHLEFTNYGSGANNWNNWNVVVANKAHGTEGYAEYFVLRADNYGWTPQTDFNATPSLRDDLTWTGNWDTFITDMNGAQVTMTIEHTNEGAVLLSAVAVGNGNTYTETYKYPVSLSEDIFAFLFTDGSHFQINKVWYSNSKKVVDHVASAYDYYLFDTPLDLSVIGAPKKIRVIYTDGTNAPADITLLGGASGTLAATAGDQTFPAIFKGASCNLVIPVKIGTSAFGSTTLHTVNWWDSWSNGFGEVFSDQSLTKNMFVYSACIHNFDGPYAHVAASNWKGLSVFRWDNWGWNDEDSNAFTNADADKERGGDDCWNWDFYRPLQNHCKTAITWTNNGGTTAEVRFDFNYANGNKVYQIYKNIAISGSIQTHCASDQCYVVVID